VLLSSLDRLTELVERVVALLDEVSLAPLPTSKPRPEPEPELVLKQHKLERPPVAEPQPEREGEIVLKQHKLASAEGWVALLASAEGYRLLQRSGAPPEPGSALELDEGRVAVLRLGPSPLPGDRRRCAYLEQEPSSAERTLDR
jgi:hypothetical protein